MKKTTRILALVLALVMCLALCACGEKKDDGQAAGGDETFTLKVGFDAEYPPFGFVADDGSYDGFDLALAQEVCTRLG